MALRPPASSIRGYVARRKADGLWEVVFGYPAATADTFYVIARATQRAPGDTTYAAVLLEPVEPDTGYFARASRATALAANDFGQVTRPYNTAALPVAASGEWFVYLLPAPTRFGYWPHGGDARYRVSADGRTLREKRRLHNTVVEYGPPPPDASRRVATWHSAVVRDMVEDTDVFLVLTRRPPMAEYIVSDTFYFRVDLDGRITAYDRDDISK